MSLINKNMILSKDQLEAIDKIKSGSILCGGVGSGKSRTALAYHYLNVAKGQLIINGSGDYEPAKETIPLYIITTARKRDNKEWEDEIAVLESPVETKWKISKSTIYLEDSGIEIIIDSWNNIKKYEEIKNCFFIFDEQRAVGKGTWAKSFIKIAKNNRWIMLSATPGDDWKDYIPVFIANGFYNNRSDFYRHHCVFKPYLNFTAIDHYKNVEILEKYRNEIIVYMKKGSYVNQPDGEVKKNIEKVWCLYDNVLFYQVAKDRFDYYKNEPCSDITSLVYSLRRVVNTHPSRIKNFIQICKTKKRVICFYNFNYELDLLRDALYKEKIPFAEWNGMTHEHIPIEKDRWVYLVQYSAGAEGWNCIETDTIVLYSLNYSYKTMVQACGRIDRLNTPFSKLYFYYCVSESIIDESILSALNNKLNFNEKIFAESIDENMLESWEEDIPF